MQGLLCGSWTRQQGGASTAAENQSHLKGRDGPKKQSLKEGESPRDTEGPSQPVSGAARGSLTLRTSLRAPGLRGGSEVAFPGATVTVLELALSSSPRFEN